MGEVHTSMTPEDQRRYDKEKAEISVRGTKLAGLLFEAYHFSEDRTRTSLVTISQAARLLGDAEFRAEVIELLQDS